MRPSVEIELLRATPQSLSPCCESAVDALFIYLSCMAQFQSNVLLLQRRADQVSMGILCASRAKCMPAEAVYPRIRQGSSA